MIGCLLLAFQLCQPGYAYAQPVYYAPQPVYYAPAPVYYPPVYAQPYGYGYGYPAINVTFGGQRQGYRGGHRRCC